MKHVVAILVRNLSRQLELPFQHGADYVELAAAGEMLRRALDQEVHQPPEAIAVLTRYESAMVDCPAGMASLLGQDQERLCMELETYAARGRMNRDPEQGLDLLSSLDRTLCAAVALTRSGVLPAGDLSRMAGAARETVRTMAGDLSDLYDLAADHRATFHVDPDGLDAFAFWDALADLAPSSLLVEAAARSPAGRRQAMVENFLEEMEQTWGKKEVRPSLIERLRNEIAAMLQLPPVLIPAPAECFDDRSASSIVQVARIGALGFLLEKENRQFVVVLDEAGHTFAMLSAVRADGTALEPRCEDPDTWVVKLPDNLGDETIRVVLRIDGEELPPISIPVG
ncbi:MAG: hypothetical protein ABIK09_19085 [Pseudomonadota bacterium]